MHRTRKLLLAFAVSFPVGLLTVLYLLSSSAGVDPLRDFSNTAVGENSDQPALPITDSAGDNIKFSPAEEKVLAELSVSDVIEEGPDDLEIYNFFTDAGLPEEMVVSLYENITSNARSSQLDGETLHQLFPPAEEYSTEAMTAIVGEFIVGDVVWTPSIYAQLSYENKQMLAAMFVSYFDENDYQFETEADLDTAFAPLIAKRESYLADLQ